MSTSEINKLSGQCKAFAEACYNQNSIEELESLYSVDETDCEEWEISVDEWCVAIAAALHDKKADLEI